MQEAQYANMTHDDLKAESGANGDHEPSSVVDSATAGSPVGEFQTHSEGVQKDLLHARDQTVATNESFSTVDPASGEPASQGNRPADDSVSDSIKPMEDKDVVMEGVSTLCADISSGVSHMDIEVNEEVANDSAISSGNSA